LSLRHRTTYDSSPYLGLYTAGQDSGGASIIRDLPRKVFHEFMQMRLPRRIAKYLIAGKMRQSRHRYRPFIT
jgi:hypothetical protein